MSQKQAFFYPGTLIKDKTRYFIEHSNCSVGVFVNRGFTSITSTVVMLYSESDEFLLRYARRLLRNNSEVIIHIVDIHKLAHSSEAIRSAIERLKEEFPHSVKSIRYTKSTSTLLNKYSFMLISYQAWNILSVSENKELRNIPSTLIINKKVSRFHTGARNKFVEHIEVDVDSDRF